MIRLQNAIMRGYGMTIDAIELTIKVRASAILGTITIGFY
jgi:hypothetical protein